MSMMLPKQNMSEEDIKLQYITPAVTAKWSREKITMETQITDGNTLFSKQEISYFRKVGKRLWSRDDGTVHCAGIR